MKRVEAQFKPVWRATRVALGGLAFLTLATVVAVGVVVWEHGRIASLQTRIAQLTAERSASSPQWTSRPAPPYDASARQFLRERAAGWAPMLRTLESGAMVGVTPTSVEFNAQDGVARVRLAYVNSEVLLDYLERINEGVPDAHGKPRWVLVEAHDDGDRSPGSATQLTEGRVQAIATIQSVWLAEPPALNR
jgi:hypothetical protein